MSGTSSPRIHPTAIVATDAHVDATASIGPYAIVEAGAKIGAGCQLGAHVVVHSAATLGNDVKVMSFAAIGGLPQDTGFAPSIRSYVHIGARTTIREGATIHRSHKPEGATLIGEDCLLMTNSHVGHDCRIGNRVILASGVLLAGHVQVADYTFIGGNSAIHQFVRIGAGVMIGGMAAIAHDVPPYVTALNRNEAHGLNLVGLKRRGASPEAIAEIKRLYRATFFKPGDIAAHARAAKAEGMAKTAEGEIFLNFFEGSKRLFIKSTYTDVD
jgi:UDP-N-acetylglucosamine acyltransferase